MISKQMYGYINGRWAVPAAFVCFQQPNPSPAVNILRSLTTKTHQPRKTYKKPYSQDKPAKMTSKTELPTRLKQSIDSTQATYKQLGKSGLRVSVPIFGAMSIGSSEWGAWVINEDKVSFDGWIAR